MKNRFELLIFDWDGTLANSIDWIVHCLQHTADAQGLNVPANEQARSIIGLSIHKSIEILFPGIDEETKEQFITRYSQTFFSRQITEQDLFVGVKQMLQDFKQAGYLLAVATGKGQAGLQKAMQGTGLDDFFHISRCADQTASKPEPVMLNEIIKEMGVAKEKAVMIGDSVHDMQMAINAGIDSIAVSCGADSKEQLQSYNPLLNLQQTIELQAIL